MIAAAHTRLGVASILAVASVGFLAAFMAAAFGYVNFAANDGLDVALAGFIEKIGSGGKIAVVGNGHGGDFFEGGFNQKIRGFRNPPPENVIPMKGKITGILFVPRNPFL